MRIRTAGVSLDLGLVATLCMLAVGLWVAFAAVTSGRALAPSLPGIVPLPEIPTTQPAPTNAAPRPPASAAPANTNEESPSAPAAPNPAQPGSGIQPRGPGEVDPAGADPYPPKPRFDEPLDPPITNVKPIRILEDR
jgi:hypothetical protein